MSLVAVSAGACDLEDSFVEAPASECREAGAQCRLPQGPLGVCERAACAPDGLPPCFRCVSQH